MVSVSSWITAPLNRYSVDVCFDTFHPVLPARDWGWSVCNVRACALLPFGLREILTGRVTRS